MKKSPSEARIRKWRWILKCDESISKRWRKEKVFHFIFIFVENQKHVFRWDSSYLYFMLQNERTCKNKTCVDTVKSCLIKDIISHRHLNIIFKNKLHTKYRVFHNFFRGFGKSYLKIIMYKAEQFISLYKQLFKAFAKFCKFSKCAHLITRHTSVLKQTSPISFNTLHSQG